MSIVPCDAFGNPGATGATFTVRMLYPGSNNVTPVTVTPSGAGSQGRLVATVIPKAVGNPALQACPDPMLSPRNIGLFPDPRPCCRLLPA